jgi:hypothetical protein
MAVQGHTDTQPGSTQCIQVALAMTFITELGGKTTRIKVRTAVTVFVDQTTIGPLGVPLFNFWS